MGDDTMIARHLADKHPTEPIPELGTVTMYYGKGSMSAHGFAWCATCREVWIVETMHAHGLRETPEKWAEMKGTSATAMRESRTKAVEYRERRSAEAERGTND